MAAHYAALPSSDSGTVATHTIDQGKGSWRAVHVLSGRCGNSAKVADYLVARGPSSEAHERVWLIDTEGDLTTRLMAARFPVETVSAADADTRAGIKGVPWLLVIEPAGRVAYSGGYVETANSRDYQDLATLRALKAGQTVRPRAIFGCITNDALQQARDPLGVGTFGR